MSDNCRFVITEHAAWRTIGPDRHRVFAFPDGAQWLVTVSGNKPSSRPLAIGVGPPQHGVFALRETAASQAPELSRALAALGSIARFRTPDLWEAIATAIIRQVIRAVHARRLYRDICEAHGQRAR